MEVAADVTILPIPRFLRDFLISGPDYRRWADTEKRIEKMAVHMPAGRCCPPAGKSPFRTRPRSGIDAQGKTIPGPAFFRGPVPSDIFVIFSINKIESHK
jgi:hypothetical protein